MKIKAFITHKQSEQFSDCQDRFRVGKDTKSIALSDGMGQSFLQDIWANILCNKYVSDKDWIPSHDSIIPLCDEWKESVQQYLKDEESKGNPFLWLIRNSISENKSAGATFVGVRINDGVLSYNILGDSCLIKISNTSKIESLEDIISSQTGEFDSFPDFYDSNPLLKGKGEPKNGTIELQKGDIFMMVSDPFSDLFYSKVAKNEDCQELISDIMKLGNKHDSFEQLVEDWRNEKGMHNDDSTLIVLEYDGKDEFEIENIDKIEDFINDEKEPSKEESTSIVSETTHNNENDKKFIEIKEHKEGTINETESSDTHISSLGKRLCDFWQRMITRENNNRDRKLSVNAIKKSFEKDFKDLYESTTAKY